MRAPPVLGVFLSRHSPTLGRDDTSTILYYYGYLMTRAEFSAISFACYTSMDITKDMLNKMCGTDDQEEDLVIVGDPRLLACIAVCARGPDGSSDPKVRPPLQNCTYTYHQTNYNGEEQYFRKPVFVRESERIKAHWRKGQLFVGFLTVDKLSGHVIRPNDELAPDYSPFFWTDYVQYCSYCFYKVDDENECDLLTCDECERVWHARCSQTEPQETSTGNIDWLCELCSGEVPVSDDDMYYDYETSDDDVDVDVDVDVDDDDDGGGGDDDDDDDDDDAIGDDDDDDKDDDGDDDDVDSDDGDGDDKGVENNHALGATSLSQAMFQLQSKGEFTPLSNLRSGDTVETGKGVFSQQHIPQYSFVLEYLGERLEYQEGLDQEAIYEQQVPDPGCFMLLIGYNRNKYWY
jgi:hypothetical protein